MVLFTVQAVYAIFRQPTQIVAPPAGNPVVEGR
jgi:hypothetical protein